MIFQGHVPPKLSKHGQDRFFKGGKVHPYTWPFYMYMGKLEFFFTPMSGAKWAPTLQAGGLPSLELT